MWFSSLGADSAENNSVAVNRRAHKQAATFRPNITPASYLAGLQSDDLIEFAVNLNRRSRRERQMARERSSSRSNSSIANHARFGPSSRSLHCSAISIATRRAMKLLNRSLMSGLSWSASCGCNSL